MSEQKITFSELANGAIEERINDVINEVLRNIADPNTDWKKKRKLNLAITFQSNEDRDFSTTEFEVKATLAPSKPIQTGIVFGVSGTKVVAAEYQNQVKGQMYVDEAMKVRAINGNK